MSEQRPKKTAAPCCTGIDEKKISMVAKCCWRKEKQKSGADDTADNSLGKKKKKSGDGGDKEHLLKRSSVDSSFTQSSVNSCHRHSSAYEDECDANLGDHDHEKEIIRANEEDLIDLTSTPPIDVSEQKQQQWSNGHRLQHSPKVTFFDQGEEHPTPFSNIGSLSPPKPRRKHEKAPVPEPRSKSAPTKIIAKEEDVGKIQAVELCQRASITSAQNVKSSLSSLSSPSRGEEDPSKKAALEEDYLQLEKVIGYSRHMCRVMTAPKTNLENLMRARLGS